MAAPTIAGFRLLEAEIYEPREGIWHADVQADTGGEDLTGAVVIDRDRLALLGRVAGGVAAPAMAGGVVVADRRGVVRARAVAGATRPNPWRGRT